MQNSESLISYPRYKRFISVNNDLGDLLLSNSFEVFPSARTWKVFLSPKFLNTACRRDGINSRFQGTTLFSFELRE